MLLHLADIKHFQAEELHQLQYRSVLWLCGSEARFLHDNPQSLPDVKSAQYSRQTGSAAGLMSSMSITSLNNALGNVQNASKAVSFGNLVLRDISR